MHIIYERIRVQVTRHELFSIQLENLNPARKIENLSVRSPNSGSYLGILDRDSSIRDRVSFAIDEIWDWVLLALYSYRCNLHNMITG